MNYLFRQIQIFFIYMKSKAQNNKNKIVSDRDRLSMINMSFVLGKSKVRHFAKLANFFRIYQYMLSSDLTLLNYFIYKVKNLNVLEEALSNKRGVLVTSISFSLNVELFFYLACKGYKVNFIFNDKSNLEGYQKSIKREQVRIYPNRFDGKIILLNDDKNETINSIKQVMEALRNNEIVIFFVDNVNSSNKKGKGLNYNFLGIDMNENIGLLEIARRIKSPILPAVAITKWFSKTDILFADNYFFMDKDEKCVNLQKMFDYFTFFIKKYPGKWLNWFSLKKEYIESIKDNKNNGQTFSQDLTND